MSGIQWHEQVQLRRLLSLQEFAHRLLPQLLRLLQAAVLPAGECPQLCLVQAQHGAQVNPAQFAAYGLPVHIWGVTGGSYLRGYQYTFGVLLVGLTIWATCAHLGCFR